MHFDVQYNRIIAIEAMDTASKEINMGNTANAKVTIQSALQFIENSISAKENLSQALIQDLKECTTEVDKGPAHGSSVLLTLATSHINQRSTNPDKSTYQNNFKKKLISEVERLRRKQILHCDKCSLIGHYSSECLQYSTMATDEEKAKQLVKCTLCGKLGHISSECLQMGGHNTCHCCGNSGHISRNCPQKDVCHFCNQKGHYSKDCLKKNSTCHKCGGTDHFADKCTALAGSTTLTCSKCHKIGHLARDCSDTVICSRCDKRGHFARDCSAPATGACYNCGEKGHRASECKLPKKKKKH